MEMESIRETEVRLTEFPSRSGSISERNSAQSSPKHMHALWKPSVEKDASAYRSPVNRVHRNNAASLQFNGSTSSRPSIFEMISDPSRFSRKKERKNDADEAQSPHDNEYDHEKQVSPKMAREGVRYTEDDVAKSPGSHYPLSRNVFSKEGCFKSFSQQR
ncbi:hypothetical protein BDQ17DRAFT_266743 [Cyathus striatus]|nr:hypothetical protein BDQ17DRAFT_266743 [Cyathus striatus]